MRDSLLGALSGGKSRAALISEFVAISSDLAE
jgi:hypothetical protein